VPSQDEVKGDELKTKRRTFLRTIFFNLIDEKALIYLCKRISQHSGDIRVVFDVMKTAF
jgi:hypothetical protein